MISHVKIIDLLVKSYLILKYFMIKSTSTKMVPFRNFVTTKFLLVKSTNRRDLSIMKFYISYLHYN